MKFKFVLLQNKQITRSIILSSLWNLTSISTLHLDNNDVTRTVPNTSYESVDAWDLMIEDHLRIGDSLWFVEKAELECPFSDESVENNRRLTIGFKLGCGAKDAAESEPNMKK